MNNFDKRLGDVIRHYQHSAHSFAISIGHEQSNTVRNAAAGRSTPSIKLAQDINVVYEEINIDWLITGRGSMMINADRSLSIDVVENSKKSNEGEAKYIVKALERAESEIETLKKNQALLEAEIVRLKGGSSPVATGT
mgnify:CR=1 FL=1